MTSIPAVRRCLALIGAVGVLAVLLGLPARDHSAPTPPRAALRSWPMWGGTVQRNLVNLSETNIAADWDSQPGKEKNIKWSVELGSRAYGGPTISGGKIFVGTNNTRPRDKNVRGDKGVLLCLRESDGAFLWQILHEKLDSGRVNDWPEQGIASTPVVEDNRIWYVSNRCEVVCATTAGLAAGNKGPFTDESPKGPMYGDIVWKLDLIKDLDVFPHNLSTCSPLIVGDTLFAITANGVDEGHINIPAPDAPSFVAIHKNLGKVLWSSKLSGRKILHGQWSNPVYAAPDGKPQIIFPGGDGWIYSFHPVTGALLWKFDCNPKGSVYRTPGGTRSDFLGTPVVWENKLYIGVGQDPEHKSGVGHLWCIDITRTPRNKDKDLSPWSNPRVEVPAKFDPKDPRNTDSALVWHYGGNAPIGAPRQYIFGRTLSTCAVHEGLVYAAELAGVLHCLDARTGKRYWAVDLRAQTWSSPYLVDGRVYIGDENGVMHLFEASKKLKVLKKVTMRGKIRATPVACNGVLYVITVNPCRLWAIK